MGSYEVLSRFGTPEQHQERREARQKVLLSDLAGLSHKVGEHRTGIVALEMQQRGLCEELLKLGWKPD
jgi:hypothetical protein